MSWLLWFLAGLATCIYLTRASVRWPTQGKAGSSFPIVGIVAGAALTFVSTALVWVALTLYGAKCRDVCGGDAQSQWWLDKSASQWSTQLILTLVAATIAFFVPTAALRAGLLPGGALAVLATGMMAYWLSFVSPAL